MVLPQLTLPQPDCRLCDLGNEGLQHPGVPSVWMEGSLPPDPSNRPLIIIGQNPGYQEDRENEPFVGPSGRMVREGFMGAGDQPIKSLCSIYLINVARCMTQSGVSIGQKCYNTCWRTYGYADIQAIAKHHEGQPLTILALGKPASIRAYQLLVPKGSPGTKISDYFVNNGITGPLQLEGCEQTQATIFFTYHPAAILREMNLAQPASAHVNLIYRHLQGTQPALSKPHFVQATTPVQSPTLPTVAAIDIETHGALSSMKPQTVFAPQKFLPCDGVHPSDAIVSVAITFPKRDPRPTPDTPWTLEMLAQLEPGPTMTFDMKKPGHKEAVAMWLRHLDTLMGMNIAYDVGCLRYCLVLHETLHDQFLIDLAVPNYTYSELRPEKSLKAIGAVRQIYKYEQTLKHQRFDTIEECMAYNGEDTHNTILGIATLANDIRADLPEPARSTKLNPMMLRYYSDLIWACVQKTEQGIPMDIDELLAITSNHLDRLNSIEATLLSDFELTIRGKGSEGSKMSHILRIIEKLQDQGHHPTDHELFTLTKKKKISTGVNNRNLFRILLPPDDPDQRLLELWQEHGDLFKVYSSYCWPLLWRRTKLKKGMPDRGSKLLPIDAKLRVPPEPSDERAKGMFIRPPLRFPGENTRGTAHPTWYIVPSTMKDGAGKEGGTKQARPVCKEPSGQTFPPIIQKCIRSRWKGGSIVSFDFSQIEMRVAGVLSGDMSLLNAYNRGDDLHTGLAIRCEGPDIINHPHFKSGDGKLDPRQWYKQGNFLILFRGGVLTFQTTVLRECNKILSSSFAQNVINALKLEREGLWAWQDEKIAEAHRNGRIDLPIIGISRYFMGGDKFDENEICNFPVQTWAGTLQNMADKDTDLALNQRTRRFPSIVPFLNVYDSGKYDCKDDGEVERIQDIMRDVVNNLTTTGLWAQLCDNTGHHVPLEYSTEIKKG